MNDTLKAAFNLVEQAQVGANAKRENGCVNGDLVRTVVLVFDHGVCNACDVLYAVKAAADVVCVCRSDNDAVILTSCRAVLVLMTAPLASS